MKKILIRMWNAIFNPCTEAHEQADDLEGKTKMVDGKEKVMKSSKDCIHPEKSRYFVKFGDWYESCSECGANIYSLTEDEKKLREKMVEALQD